jgi:hypothetical protein
MEAQDFRGMGETMSSPMEDKGLTASSHGLSPALRAQEKEWTTRRAPHMERWTRIQPIVVQDFPDAHILILKVGNQEFRIDSGNGFFDTKEEAEWSRDMLCIALDAMARDLHEPRGLSASEAPVERAVNTKDSPNV